HFEKRRKIPGSSHLFPGGRTTTTTGLELAPGAARAAGCRGFAGPVPPPLAMRFVISTNADKLIDRLKGVNFFFCRRPVRPGPVQCRAGAALLGVGIHRKSGDNRSPHSSRAPP